MLDVGNIRKKENRIIVFLNIELLYKLVVENIKLK